MRLLIAEGSPILRKRLTGLFSDLGNISLVAFVQNLADVQQMALAEKPDVIVIDIGFPTLANLSMLAALKDETKHPQVIVLTETAEPRHIRQFKNSGADMVFDMKDDLNTFVGHLKILVDGVSKTPVV